MATCQTFAHFKLIQCMHNSDWQYVWV